MTKSVLESILLLRAHSEGLLSLLREVELASERFPTSGQTFRLSADEWAFRQHSRRIVDVADAFFNAMHDLGYAPRLCPTEGEPGLRFLALAYHEIDRLQKFCLNPAHRFNVDRLAAPQLYIRQLNGMLTCLEDAPTLTAAVEAGLRVHPQHSESSDRRRFPPSSVIRPCQRDAFRSWQTAHSECLGMTDEEAYYWLWKNPDRWVGFILPPPKRFETWCRYLRAMRKRLDKRKNLPAGASRLHARSAEPFPSKKERPRVRSQDEEDALPPFP